MASIVTTAAMARMWTVWTVGTNQPALANVWLSQVAASQSQKR